MALSMDIATLHVISGMFFNSAISNSKRKGMKIKKRHNIPTYQLKDLLSFGFSINYIAKLYKCDWSTVRSRIYENPELLNLR